MVIEPTIVEALMSEASHMISPIQGLDSRVYCYVRSTNPSVVQRLSRLELNDLSALGGEPAAARFLSDGSGPDPIFLRVINNVGDWKTPEFSAYRHQVSDTQESLVSCARDHGGIFGCCTDFWGLRTHYWHHSAGTFVCSNNLFLVAHLLGAGLDETALHEYLFFLSPIGDRTFFEKIYALSPGQVLQYDPRADRIDLSPSRPPDLALLDQRGRDEDFVTAFLEFIGDALADCQPRTSAVALSSGTDSTAVLAGLLHNRAEARAVSFGMPDYFEAQKTGSLAKSLGIPFDLVPLLTAEEWRQSIRDATFWTNGLINPLRLHYRKLYEAIPLGDALFEGTLGSQFVKGDFPVGSAVSECQVFVLLGRGGVTEAVDHYLAPLPPDLRNGIVRTVAEHHQAITQPVHTPTGRRAFQGFALRNIPRAMFAGPLILASDRLRLYLPYLGKSFLRGLFASGIPGFATGGGLGDSLPLATKMKAHALITAVADHRIDSWTTGKGISFREARALPLSICKCLAALRLRYFRGFRYRRAFFGQINNEVSRRELKSSLEGWSAPWGPWQPEKAGVRLRMCGTNLRILQGTLDALNDGWRPWLD